MILMINSRLAGRETGRPGGRRMLCAALLLGLAVAGCTRPAAAPPAPPALAPVPDVVEPAWLEAGQLDLRFTVTHHDGQTGARTSQIHTVFTVAAGGRVRAMRTAQSANGVVTSFTTWNGGTTIESAQLPGCKPALTEVPIPASLPAWLAETFGPVNTATGAGWSVSGSTASRPGSSADTVEQAQLTRLPERATREVTTTTGAVVSEVTHIEVHHADPVEPAGDFLPPCGQSERPVEGLRSLVLTRSPAAIN
jgi:hypothetical protein